MKCSDYARSAGRPCRMTAHVALAAIGVPFCEVHGRERGYLSADGKASSAALALASGNGAEAQQAAPAAPSLPAPARTPTPTTPDTPEAEAEPTPDAALFEFPAAPGLADEFTPTAPPADGWDKVEAQASNFWGDAARAETPAAADAAAAKNQSAPKPAGSSAGALLTGGDWNGERAEKLVRFICNPLFRRSGKDELTADEAREGGEAMAPVFAALFKEANSPYTAAIVWAFFVFVGRYAGDAMRFIQRKRAPSIAPTVERAAAVEMDPAGGSSDAPASGWGRVAA